MDDAALIEGINSVGRILKNVVRLNQPISPPKPPDPEYKVLYRVCCEAFAGRPAYSLDTDPPYHRPHYGYESHLVTGNRVTNLDLYIERNRHAPFVVFREYICCSEKQRDLVQDNPEPRTEKLVILSPRLLKVFNEIRHQDSNTKMLYPEFQLGTEIERPHLWTYFGMEDIERSFLDLSAEDGAVDLSLFLAYFRDEKEDLHDQLRVLLSKGLITLNLVEYLFVSELSLSLLTSLH